MRYFILSVLVFTCCFTTAVGQTAKPFKLTGKIPVSVNGPISLSYMDAGGKFKRDTATVRNGQFSFSGSLMNATWADLAYAKASVRLFIEPGNITFDTKDAQLGHARITGSTAALEYQQLATELEKIEKRWKIVIDTLTAIGKRSNQKFQETKAWALKPYLEEQKEVYAAFYEQYPSSYVTAQTLGINGRDMSTDFLRKLYGRFSAQVKASTWGQGVAKQLAERKLGAVGSVAANFNHTGIDGKPLELSTLRGKYVLLDFWGSWCVPCRKGNPHLLDVYAQYKSKGLEIVGIAADDSTPDAWRKAVADDKLTWPQILQGNKPGDDLGKAYNIIYYPTKILIDKQGKIIGRFGEAPEELDKMLKDLM